MQSLLSKYPEYKACQFSPAAVGFTFKLPNSSTLMCATAMAELNGNKVKFIAFPGRISKDGSVRNVPIIGMDFYIGSGPFSGTKTWYAENELSTDDILKLSGFEPIGEAKHTKDNVELELKKLETEYQEKASAVNSYISDLNTKISKLNKKLSQQNEKLADISSEYQQKRQEITNQFSNETDNSAKQYGILDKYLKYLTFIRNKDAESYIPNRYKNVRKMLGVLSNGDSKIVNIADLKEGDRVHNISSGCIVGGYKPEINIKFVDPEDDEISTISRSCSGELLMNMKYFEFPDKHQKFSHGEFVSMLISLLKERYKKSKKTLTNNSITVDILYSDVDFNQSYLC